MARPCPFGEMRNSRARSPAVRIAGGAGAARLSVSAALPRLAVFVVLLLLIALAADHPVVVRTAGTVSPLGGHWSPANQTDPDAVAVPAAIESMPAGAVAVVQAEPL